MTVAEMYSQTTEQGCNETLGRILGLDDNITIGELKSFLEMRRNKAKQQFNIEKQKMLDEISGKCFRIDFGEHHVTLLKIDRIDVIEEYGFVTGILYGEKLTNYNGDISMSLLTTEKSAKKWENYFPNRSCEEVPLKTFEEHKSKYLEIQF